MNFRRYIKDNSGSTLTMVLFMLFLLSVTAIAVITITGSELSMSVMNSDRSKALMAAQAGAQAAAQTIDEQVAVVQEEARGEASEKLKNAVHSFYTSPIEDTTSIFYNVIEHGSGIVLDDDRLNSIFKGYYLTEFNSRITTWINDQASNTWKPENPFNVNNVDNSAGTYNYKSISLVSDGTATSGVKLVSTGSYNKVKRNIDIELSFLTESSTGGTQEVPVSYGKLTKVRMNKNTKPELIGNKAVVAMKNIVSVGGEATINGDITCFGTIARDPTDPSKEDFDATGYSYGGIMAGVTSNIWTDANIGLSLKNSANLKARLGINDSYFNDTPGSITVNGNVATMSYVHSLYGTYNITENKYYKSNITITGDTFARAVQLEKNSHFSDIQLNNVYLTDDLIVNSSDSEVKIGKWFNASNPDPANRGKLVGLEKGTDGDSTRTSAVVIGGDSQLRLNGKIYVGGSTSFNELISVTTPSSMYISGLSVLKSGNQPSDAFKIFPDDQLIAGAFPNNTFYLYDNSTNSYNNITTSDTLRKATYNYTPSVGTPSAIDMMEGILGAAKPFDIITKAMHFKKIWDDFWTSSIGYSSTINADEIIITTTPSPITTSTEEVLDGWCGGAVAANDTIYGPYGGFSESNYEYTNEVTLATKNYKNAVKMFFTEYDASGNPKSLDPSSIDLKAIDSKSAPAASLNIDSLTDGAIQLTHSNTFAYRAIGDVIISPDSLYNVNKGASGIISKDSDGFIRGVVYSSGDIYIKEGTKFKGILIAGGNIVFLGDATVSFDEDTLDILLSEKPVEMEKFFKYSPKDTVLNDSTIYTARLSNVKNIKIKSWKEI